MKQIEYFAYTGQLEVWLASKGIDLVFAAPALEPIYEFGGRDGHLRISNHRVDDYRGIPSGGRWSVEQTYDVLRRRGIGNRSWIVFESTGQGGYRWVSRAGTRAEAEALVRARPARPVQPNQD